ncbi:CAP domain-containing protein [Actinoplanes sp. CA-252034]|uniref:CAP domain-containing protein n=1 Tax=Actinoplanes sp. CA-252034 TaxID=3239906 RepID=UPI003D9835AD
MRQLLRRLAVTALLAPAAAGAMTMIATPAEAAPAKASEQALQTEVNRLTNIERTKQGCGALKVNSQLTAAARGHSAWMAKTGTFSHTGGGGSSFVARARATGYGQPSAENIAWGFQTAASVVEGWMRSPGHRANIVNCKSKSVGVGVVLSASGTPYYTQDFGY